MKKKKTESALVKKRKAEVQFLLNKVKTSDALYSIWSALEANPERLAERLRQGNASKAEMALAADLIEGKTKPERPRSSRSERLMIVEQVAWVKKHCPAWWPRKKIIGKAIELLKLHSPDREVSDRHVYDAEAEFDPDTVTQIDRLPENENERVIEPNQRLRDDLNECSRDLLIQIIEEFLERE